ncbi:hypothetical protein [Allorhizobium taibaishanense]|uniref:DUF945 domain-containing protein n=1 Tax=Allorhizobium taibaishanense TaxID=887144 RepID=A0A1Q8ZZ33_9HYPH|nr:hypothetical protein [Allorhizobium taibaishanense]MBB4007518.1 hypothetical protein [Allorhizobium taibaishanense]OLP47536.1 hypothetical protein BJF91_03780 [Allorhizobium taibaishanense]
MTTHKSAALLAGRLLWASAAIAILPSSAFALDGQDLLAKINAAYAAGTASITAGSVDISGDVVTLRDTKLKPAKGENQTPVSIGDVKMSGVSENEDGSYEIDRVDFQPLNLVEKGSTINASDLYLAGVTIPAKTDSGDLASLLVYEKAHVGPVSVRSEGKEVLSMAEAQGTSTIEDDGASVSFDGWIKGFKLDLSTIDDPKSKDAIEKLGLSMLDGGMTVKGSWELQSGTIDVESYVVDFKNVGKLSLSFSLSGYTLDLVKQLQETAKAMEANAKDPQAQQASGIAILGLMQQMSFLGADIRFDDAGITERALAYAGSQQGVSGKDMGQMVKAMVPLMLAQAKLGDFQNVVTAAVNAYIDNPKNLTVSATPEKPVPFPMIVGAAMGAPETLPKVLGAKVTANN